MRGASTTDDQFAYFTPAGFNSVYQYRFITEKWEELPSCPCDNSGLVIIGGALTAVGGEIKFSRTNKLYTLRQGKWKEEHPPMNNAHSQPAVVSAPDGKGCFVFVIGGDDDSRHWTTTVEMLDIHTSKWYKLTDLPRPLTRPSATVCGDTMHVIGGSIGYSCDLEALLYSNKPIASEPIISWTPLPWLPVTFSTAATLCGQLVTICGWRNKSLVSSIHQLVEGEWVEIGKTSSGRSWCLVASQSPKKIIIVGVGKEWNGVEECIAQ